MVQTGIKWNVSGGAFSSKILAVEQGGESSKASQTITNWKSSPIKGQSVEGRRSL